MICEPFPEPKDTAKKKKNFAATINRLLVWDGMVEMVGEREREGLMGLF